MRQGVHEHGIITHGVGCDQEPFRVRLAEDAPFGAAVVDQAARPARDAADRGTDIRRTVPEFMVTVIFSVPAKD